MITYTNFKSINDRYRILLVLFVTFCCFSSVNLNAQACIVGDEEILAKWDFNSSTEACNGAISSKKKFWNARKALVLDGGNTYCPNINTGCGQAIFSAHGFGNTNDFANGVCLAGFNGGRWIWPYNHATDWDPNSTTFDPEVATLYTTYSFPAGSPGILTGFASTLVSRGAADGTVQFAKQGVAVYRNGVLIYSTEVNLSTSNTNALLDFPFPSTSEFKTDGSAAVEFEVRFAMVNRLRSGLSGFDDFCIRGICGASGGADVAASPSTCAPDATNNGTITVAEFTTGEKFDYTLGGTYTGTKTFANADLIPVNGVIVDTISVKSMATQYTIRVFREDCHQDVTVTMPPTFCPFTCNFPAATVAVTQATCTGETANNNASINVTGISDADRIGMSVGQTYTGPDYAGATAVSGTSFLYDNLNNPTCKEYYTIRIFNGADESPDQCVNTFTVVLDEVSCNGCLIACASIESSTSLETSPVDNLGKGELCVEDGNIDLELTKTVTPNSGETCPSETEFVWTVTVTNKGDITATEVVVFENLPEGLSADNIVTSLGTFNGFGDWKVGSLAPNASETLVFSSKAMAAGTYENCAYISNALPDNDIDSSPDNDNTANEDDDACATITVTGPSLPTLTKEFSPFTTKPNLPSTLILRLFNNDTVPIALTQDLVDVLPNDPAQMVVAADPNINTLLGGVTAEPGASTITVASGTVLLSGLNLLEVDVVAPTAGLYCNIIGIGDLATTACTNVDSVVGCLEVGDFVVTPLLSKSFDKDLTEIGDQANLTIVIENRNPTNFELVMDFMDAMPSGLTLAGTMSGTCPAITNFGGDSLTVGIAAGAMIPPGTCTIIVPVTATLAKDYCNSIGQNELVVMGTANGITEMVGNRSVAKATLTAVEDPIFDLALKKTLADSQTDTVTVGSTVTYDITVFNQGTAEGTAINVTDYIPTGLNLVTGGNWEISGDDAVLVNPIPSLVAGADTTIQIQFTVDVNFGGSSITNTAEINTATGGTDIDSTPDNTEGNDKGGKVISPTDNSLFGNAKLPGGAPQDENGLTDEDDSDPAIIFLKTDENPNCAVVLSLDPQDCNTGDNTYSLDGAINFTNAPTTGTLIVVIDGVTTQTINAPFTSPQAIALTGLNADGQNHTVNVQFTADGSCQTTLMYAAPSPCLATSTCSVTATINPGTCESATNTYDLTGAITFTDAPASGTLVVAVGPFQQVFAAPFTSPQDYTLTGLIADGSNHAVSVSFSDDVACSYVADYTAPSGCDPIACGATISVTEGTCNAATNTFDLTGSVTFTNVPTTGTLVVEVGGDTMTFAAPFSSPQAFTINDLIADGQTAQAVAYFSDDIACTATANYTAPVACSPSVCAVSMELTPSPCADDKYVLTGSVNFVNPPATGMLSIREGGTIYFELALPLSSPLGFSIPNLTADGASHTFQVSFSDELACANDFTYMAPASCTGNCAVSGTVTNIECRDNGTDADTGDDYTIFSLNPTGTNLGGTYSVTSDAGTVYRLSGAAATNVPYGSTTVFRLANGSADGTDKMVSIIDDANPACSVGPITITAPDPCSVVPCVTIENPISETICANETYAFDGQDLNTAGTYRDTLTAANGCDSVVILTLTILPISETPISQDICNGDNFTFNSQALTTAGTYRDTMTAANGCDSVIVLTLNILDTVQTPITEEICNGASFNFNNQDLTAAGTYRDTMTAANGCDSFIVLTLTIIDALETNLSEEICNGDSYTFDGQALTTAGTYRDTMTAASGCDSILILTLNILNPVQTDLNEEICQGDNYTFDSQALTTAGIYRDTTTGSNGCDSIIVLTLSILDTVQTPVTEEICQGETFTFNNQDLAAAGTYRDTMIAANGCDSIIVLTLDILPTSETPISQDICNGDNFTFNSQALTAAGTYRDTMTAANGCDSVIVLTLNVLDTVQTPITEEICNGASFNFNNQDLTAAGTYRDTMTAANGCDSFIVLTLTIIDALETNLSEEICQGDSYTFDSQALTTAGTYRDTMTAASGCDSILILTLNILNPVQTDLNEEICQGDSYTFDSQALITAGTYRDTMTAANGCDSIIVLTLSILDTVQTPITEEICQGETFTFNNQDLTAAGTYRDTLTAANGCDSFIVLTLNILPTSETPITENICNGDSFTFNSQALTAAGTYRDTMTAANGCDSVIVLTLNILDTVQTPITEEICNGASFNFNNQDLTAAGTYRDTMTAANGCDSFIVLTLTIIDALETNLSESICDGDSYTFDSQVLTTAGTYRDTMTATGGCDSIIILTLNVLDLAETALSAEICQGDSYIFDNQTLTTAGIYRDTTTGSNGCDSITVLTLSILDTVQTPVTEEICQGETFTFNNQDLAAAGTYRDTLTAANGCDSFIVLTLNILPTSETPISEDICNGNSFTFNSQALTAAGTYRDTMTAANGCDSVIVLTLNVLDTVQTPITEEICNDASFNFNNQDLTTAGTYRDTMTAANGCDSFIVLTLTIIDALETNLSESICDGDSYTFDSQVLTTAGTYRDTMTATGGCDSIIILTLNVLDPAETALSAEICQGDSYTFDSQALITAGTYRDTMTATNGCDSIIVLILSILDTVQTPVTEEICQGETFTFNNQDLTAAGTYRDTLTAANGCDSFIVLTLNILPTSETPISEDICNGNSFTFNSQALTAAGTYRDTMTAANGCDSVIVLTLNVLDTVQTPITEEICNGASFNFNNQDLTAAGTYRDTMTAANGCDSFIVLTLTIIDALETNLSEEICQGDSYTFDSEALTTAGTYRDTMTAIGGCDSIIILTLNVLDPAETALSAEICQGDSYTFDSQALITAGTYRDTMTATNGCDSIIVLTLSILDTVETPVTEEICQGETFTFNNQDLTAAGTYRDTLTAANGCDSFIVLTLNILPTSETPITESICNGDTYTFNTADLETAGIYRDTLTATNGCDSIIVLTLNVLDTVQTAISEEICQGENYTFNTQNLTTAGVYRDTMTAANGCDSIIILTLNVIEEMETAISEEICNGENLIFNNQTLTTVGTYRDTMTAAGGCDSIIVLTLNILDEIETAISQDICFLGNYTFGNQVLTASGTYRDTMTAVSGCDSIIILTLNVLDKIEVEIREIICEGDSFDFNNQTLTTAGIYRDTISVTAICDSLIILTLDVLSPVQTAISETICQGDNYTFDNQILTTTGIYKDTVSAASGCDSIITLTLTVNPNTTANVDYEGCENDGYSVVVGSTTYDENNPMGTKVLTNATGCDSTVTVNLVFNSEKVSEITYVGCAEDGYEVAVNGTIYSENNTNGTETFTAANGCDSIVTINLVFNPLTDNACGKFDLALEKSTDSTTVRLGDLVTYTIKVTNEGTIDAYNIGITDFIPAGMSLADDNWTASGDTARFNTPISFLPAGADFNLYIRLKVNLDFTGTTLVNFAEISEADDDEDPTNTPPTDEDSTPDEDPTNPDEDDDDSAVINVVEEGEDIFDLALIETLAPGQSGMVKPGDEVDFKITIFNQGTLPAETIEITQYLPVDVTLNGTNPQGWTAVNDSTATITLTVGDQLPIGGLAPDSMIMVMIQVVIDENTTALKLTPHAEISDDGANNDNDSTPDDNRTDDAGGEPNTDTDDSVDQIAPTDEDDSDPVQVMLQQFDLALTEELLTEGPLVPGDSITGKIKVFNQGEIAADNIKLFAYIPAGLQLDDDRWTAMDDSTAMLTLSVATNDLPTGGLTPNEMTMITIGFTIDPTFMDTCLITYAEIGNATDETGNPVNDVDSKPDGNSTNDTGGEVFTSTDNQIFATPPTDEDDHDPMKIAVKQTFDLALEKSTDSTIVRLGDLVTYQLTITNEGTLDAYNIGLTDFIPTGMSLQDNNWTASGDTARYNTPITYLATGNSTTIEITMQVDTSFSGSSLMNIAEISTADDDNDPTNEPPTDEDSTPDEDPENKDEDDDDPAVITVIPPTDPNNPTATPEVFDLALTETLAPNQSPMVRPGEAVDFKITIFNQGNVAADTIKLMQYLPADLMLNGANPQGWTAMDDSTAMILLTVGNGLPIGGLAPDSMLMVMIQVVVATDATELKLTPYAEISEDGENNEDHDSTPNDDRTDDVGGQINTDTDDVTDLLPPMDEDDHDPVQIMLLEFDLAITEELITEGEVEPGDSITGKIKVFNQGGIPADNIKVFAYIPAGMTLADDSWTAMNDSTAMLTLTVANGDLPTGGLTPTTMTMVTIDFVIDPDFMEECLITYAEIGNATDENGDAVTDTDSTPDDDRTNDTGGEINTTTDNEINETPPTDEDDHDPMKVTVKQIFDLALIIDYAPNQDVEVLENDTVCFNVKIVNQGSLDAFDIGIVNYVPEGLIFDAALNQNLGHNWQADSTYQLDELLVGDTAIIPIKFIVDMNQMDSIVIDTAEIYFATTEDGGTMNATDIDSEADNVNEDFIGGDNLLDNEMKDEDDHDIVFVVNLQEVDPIGFIYADKTGKIIKGGTISVATPPGGVAMIMMDGSDGMYKWFTNGVQGEYVMTYTHPDGLIMSPNCTPTAGVYDPTGRDGATEDMDGDATNGIVQLGTIAVNADSTYLLNPTCGNNPYYLRFFLQSGDPIIDGNNIAIQESFIGSIVCEDTNGNGQSDAGEPGIPNALVYLYACADTINPIDSTLTNAQGAYNFDGLSAGNYMVQFTTPDGYRLPMDAVPTNEIAVRGGYSNCISLTTGQCDTTTTVCMKACTEIVATVSANTIIQGETITISLTGGPEFIWSANTGITNTTTAVATLSPSTNTTYTVTVNDTYGCSQTLSIPIAVTPLTQNYVRIADPCNCTTESINNIPAFTDRITIFSLTANENWTIAENVGIYGNGSLVSEGTSFVPGGIVDGYYTYSMPIQHLDAAGYTGKFSNGTDELMATNICFADQSCSTTIVTTPDGTPGPPVVGPPIIIIPSGPTPLLDTLADCSGTDFRSEGAEDNTLYYDDSTRNNVMTICAQNAWQSLLVTFSEFDLATGDTLFVFEGRDTLASKLIAKYGGSGVSQTGGWVASSCDPKINPHGCLTFQFKTNGDNAKGLGWRAQVTCNDNNITLTPPNNLSANLGCEESYAIFDIKPLAVTADCGTVQDSQIVRIFNQHGVICLDTCLADADVVRDTFALGAYIVQYKLKSDTTKTAQAILSVQAPSLVCNDEINVPLGSSCAVILTPDDLLESTCDTITDTMYYFISIIGKDKNGKDKALATGGGKGGNYPMVDKEMIDQCGGSITAKIEKRYYEGLDLSFCNNGPQSASCEVKVNLMDQSAPTFMNLPPVDTFVICAIDLTQTGLGLPTPDAVDNCGDATVTFVDATITSQGSTACDTTRATVTWRAADECGNTTTATQSLVFVRPNLDDIVKTRKVTLSCDGNDGADVVTEIPGIKIGRLKNGILIPSDTIPLSTEIYTCGYILENKDVFIPAADCGKKIFRYWTILDWCDSGNGPQPIDTTFIEFKDTKAPEFVAGVGTTATIALDHFSCTYDITKVATPAATDNCSTPTVRLNKVSRIEDGALWTIPATEWAALNCDSFQLEWIAADDCHEQLVNDTVNQIIIIEDNTKPSAVCTDKLHISLGRDAVRVHYNQVDGGSSDACGIAKYEISRDEITWDSVAIFGCEDLHQDNKLYLRVTDTKGNQNTCWTNIIVEDKIAPICSDLPTMTGTCDDGHIGNGLAATDTNENKEMDDNEWIDLTDEQAVEMNTKYGSPNCSDNVTCQELVIQQQYQLIEKACGIATIKRRYRAIDWDGQGMTSDWAEQTINIESKADWSITLPTDWKGNCGEDVPTSEVQITNGACDLMAYEVEEKVFGANSPSGAGGDACLKVVRTFTIINWCNYQAGDEAQVISRVENEHGMVTESATITSEGLEKVGKLVYIQILKLTDETAPVITVEPTDDCLTADDCQAPKRFAITATDCNEAATATLTYSWTISAGDTELGNGEGAEFEYPVATGVKYEVEWKVADNCGNTAARTVEYQFTDCKKPAPYCLNGVAVELMPPDSYREHGMIQIWAKDLDAGSSDNCTPTNRLALKIWHESLGDAPTHIAGVLALPENVTFDCAYLGNQVVNIYVIDEANNWDFCVTYVNVQDNMGACQNTDAEGMAIVSGTIMDWRQQTVEQVEVTPIATEENSNSMITKADGHYDFELAMNKEYTIRPAKDMHPLNGVSTFDLVLMAKHILGVSTFDNPYQLIAADVNGSGTITAFDMVQIRQLILNITTEFSNSPSWKFVDAEYEMTMDKPMSADFPQVVTIANLDHDMQMDFVAIKIGDVNGNANPNGFVQATDRTIGKVFEITTEDKALKVGETYTVTFNTEQLETIQGYQFTLGYDNLKVEELKSGVVGVENFGLHKMDKGMITTSWNQSLAVGSTQLAVSSSSKQYANPQPVTGNSQLATLFTIEFTAERDGKLSEQLSILNRPTAIEAYDENGDLMEVELRFTTPNLADEFELFQNQPNPFHDKTTIGFYLPGDSEVQLILRDETGRVLKTIKEDRKAGHNSIQLNKEALTNGFIYYQLSTKFGTKAKKMLRIK